MQQLYMLLCDDFEEDTHRLLLDISCNAYARTSGGGARVKLAVAEDVIVRALVAFNVLDVHYDQARAHRHASFIRCLSTPLLPPTPTLTSESLILHCYTRACLAPHTLSFTPAPKMLAANPFGAPLPQWAVQVAGVGGPCVGHSYAGEDDGMQHVCHTSHVTRHTSHVTRHTSHVTRHTSHVTHHTSSQPTPA